MERYYDEEEVGGKERGRKREKEGRGYIRMKTKENKDADGFRVLVTCGSDP